MDHRADGCYRQIDQAQAGIMITESIGCESYDIEVPAAMDDPYADQLPAENDSLPVGVVTVEWRRVGTRAFKPLSLRRPMIARGAEPADLEFRVTMIASATHLRSAILTSVDCADGGLSLGGLSLVDGVTEHWQVVASDRSETLRAIYFLSRKASAGVYGFSGEITSSTKPSESAIQAPRSEPWVFHAHDKQVYPCVSFLVVDEDEPSTQRPVTEMGAVNQVLVAQALSI